MTPSYSFFVPSFSNRCKASKFFWQSIFDTAITRAEPEASIIFFTSTLRGKNEEEVRCQLKPLICKKKKKKKKKKEWIRVCIKGIDSFKILQFFVEQSFILPWKEKKSKYTILRCLNTKQFKQKKPPAFFIVILLNHSTRRGSLAMDFEINL